MNLRCAKANEGIQNLNCIWIFETFPPQFLNFQFRNNWITQINQIMQMILPASIKQSEALMLFI